MDSKGEVILTIMASLAQQESESLSHNVKLGLQYLYQQGEIQVNCKWFLGYTKDENKRQTTFKLSLAMKTEKPLPTYDKRLKDVQTELLKLASSKADYEDVADEIYRLSVEKQKVQLENAGRDELKKQISDTVDFLKGQPTAITVYDEPLDRRLMEKVTIFEEKFTVEFKSGATVGVNV